MGLKERWTSHNCQIQRLSKAMSRRRPRMRNKKVDDFTSTYGPRKLVPCPMAVHPKLFRLRSPIYLARSEHLKVKKWLADKKPNAKISIDFIFLGFCCTLHFIVLGTLVSCCLATHRKVLRPCSKSSGQGNTCEMELVSIGLSLFSKKSEARDRHIDNIRQW